MLGAVPGTLRVQGEFRLSSALVRRVQRAVEEIVRETALPDLSHVDDDCPLCREASRDASQPDRTGNQWIA